MAFAVGLIIVKLSPVMTNGHTPGAWAVPAHPLKAEATVTTVRKRRTTYLTRKEIVRTPSAHWVAIPPVRARSAPGKCGCSLTAKGIDAFEEIGGFSGDALHFGFVRQRLGDCAEAVANELTFY